MSHQPDLVHQIIRETDSITHQNIIIYSITAVTRSTRKKPRTPYQQKNLVNRRSLRQLRSFCFYWPTEVRTPPSSWLRTYAEILLLHYGPMHCFFSRPAYFTSGTHPRTLSRRVLQLVAHSHRTNRATYFNWWHAP